MRRVLYVTAIVTAGGPLPEDSQDLTCDPAANTNRMSARGSGTRTRMREKREALDARYGINYLP